MKVKAIWMLNDYTWKKFEREVSGREEADAVSTEIARRLNKAVNNGKIKDYRVEY